MYIHVLLNRSCQYGVHRNMIFQDFGPTCLMFNVLLKDWFKELKRIYCEEFGQEYVKLSITN